MKNDPTELEEHSHLVMLFEVHKDAQQFFSFAGSSGLAHDTVNLESMTNSSCSSDSAVSFSSPVQIKLASTCGSVFWHHLEPLNPRLVHNVDILLWSVKLLPKRFMYIFLCNLPPHSTFRLAKSSGLYPFIATFG